MTALHPEFRQDYVGALEKHSSDNDLFLNRWGAGLKQVSLSCVFVLVWLRDENVHSSTLQDAVNMYLCLNQELYVQLQPETVTIGDCLQIPLLQILAYM